MNYKNQNGSALYIVLIFSIIILATASIYVLGQYSFSRSSRKDPARLQTLLNARSGIWYGLAMLDKSVEEQKNSMDTIKSASTSIFGDDMFADDPDDSDGKEDANTTVEELFDQGAVEVAPFGRNQYGYFTISLEPSGYFRILESVGNFHNLENTVVAKIGSKPFVNSDTVLFLRTEGMPEGTGSIDGSIAFLTKSIDNSDSLMQKRFFVNMDEVTNIVEKNKSFLRNMSDSETILEQPVTVQYEDDFEDINDTIYGSLLIDGASRDLRWKAKRTIYVLEELQFTGDVFIENVHFVVGGDVKIFDNTELKAVEIFTSARIFFAGESVFRGNAMACGDIEIYETAQVLGKSIIISTGFAKQKKMPNQKDLSSDLKNELNKPKDKTTFETKTAKDIKTGDTKSGKKSPTKKNKGKPYSLYVRDQATVNAILIDLKKLGGISIDVETIITGIVWARGRICHRGRMKGVMFAQTLVEEGNPFDMKRNFIYGTLKELETIDRYILPYFISVPAIVSWIEES